MEGTTSGTGVSRRLVGGSGRVPGSPAEIPGEPLQPAHAAAAQLQHMPAVIMAPEDGSVRLAASGLGRVVQQQPEIDGPEIEALTAETTDVPAGLP